MPKLNHCLIAILLMLLYPLSIFSQTGYVVTYIPDSAAGIAKLQASFTTQSAARDYINKLPSTLQNQGYITASVDHIEYDSLHAKVALFLGQRYQWAVIHTSDSDIDLLEAVRWNPGQYQNKTLQFAQFQNLQQRILDHLEENGYPFARIYLDDVKLQESQIEAQLKIDRGHLYKIDSIRIHGDANIKNEFIQKYLGIANGSYYNKKRLENVGKKIAELPYVQEERPSDLTLLGSGSVLNVYLKPKKTSQVNALIGFLPNSQASGKLQVTADVNLLFRNALSAGETIGLNWQKLQPQSQRLNLLYEHPYIFNSNYGLGFNFNMFRKDSSFLNLDMKLAATFGAGEVQSASLFIERRQTLVSDINANRVIITRTLPAEADVSSNNMGFTYNLNNTNYRFNPQRGNEFFITTSAGTKNIKRNNEVLELKDPGDPDFKFSSLYDTVKLKTFQFRVQLQGAHFFPIGKQSTIKAGLNGGLFSSGNIFRNELFQIGGYRMLRGFDEESQYLSQYAIATLEYRYLIGQNSNFFAFTDGGWGRQTKQLTNTYLGTGLGLSFETKAGILNLIWAIGKRDDTEFNLRQSKLHFGFANYF